LSWSPQLVLQVPLPAHWNVQLPPGQSKLQSAPSWHCIWQPPPSQVALQVDLPLQV
jgi:hypothetical protein